MTAINNNTQIQPVKIQVRFSDIDSMGHVNNSVYLSYFEYARIVYFTPLLGKDWDWKKYGIILKKNEIEYIKPVFLDQTPEIRIYLLNIGTKSFTLGYELTVNSEIYTTGSSVLVGFDSHENSTIELPARMREVLEDLNKD
jgi:acyl-CoA thioester hydrolase